MKSTEAFISCLSEVKIKLSLTLSFRFIWGKKDSEIETTIFELNLRKTIDKIKL